METVETISITVNDEPKTAPSGATVTQLLESLALRPGRVAIERNLQILPRSEWATTRVAAGDRYEIVQFVGGG
jgi:thiamine biosynthesis protein ThiS